MFNDKKISVQVLVKKAGKLPQLNLQRDVFPQDKQKVKPLLGILASVPDLRLEAANEAAQHLAEYLEHCQIVFDVKRIDPRQPNPAGLSVTTLEQRKLKMAQARVYFLQVRFYFVFMLLLFISTLLMFPS